MDTLYYKKKITLENSFRFTLWYILLSVKVDVLNELVSNPGFILLNSIIDDEFSYPLLSFPRLRVSLIFKDIIQDKSHCTRYLSGFQGVSLHPVSCRITGSVIAPGIIQDYREYHCTRYHSGVQEVSLHPVSFRSSGSVIAPGIIQEFRKCHFTRYPSGYTESFIAPGIMQNYREYNCTRYHLGLQGVSLHPVSFRI